MIDIKLTGQRIKELCSQKGITVKQIQKELNIGAFQSIYNWFSGKTLPTLDNFYYLSKILNVPMESMLIEKPARKSDSSKGIIGWQRTQNLVFDIDVVQIEPMWFGMRMYQYWGNYIKM